MKRIYEHRPGLFGLDSIAAGYSAKYAEARSQTDSTLASEDAQFKNQSQSEAGEANESSQSRGSISGNANESGSRSRRIRL
jgi:hypothetical protein